jgi:N,N'-diacetyllegionaminate synthase
MEIWAEAGSCEGDVDYALRAAQAVHDAGADALKVQWYHPDRVFSHNVPRYDTIPDVRGTTQNEVAGLSLDYESWRPVVALCNELGIRFVPSIFDPEAIPYLEKYALSHAKIASGDITNRWLIQDVADALRFHQPHQPTLCLSTGASTADEIARAVGWIADAEFRGNLQLLACHLAYPSEDADANLYRVSSLASLAAELVVNRQVGRIAKIDIGYSDHTSTLSTASLLTAMNAAVLEKHFTLLGKGHGADHEFALDPPSLFNLVQERDRTKVLMGSAALAPSPNEQSARNGARRSLAAARDIPKLTPLTVDMFIMLRPGNGIQPYEMDKVIGAGTNKQQLAMVDIPAGTVVTWRMIGRAGASLTVE